MIQLMMLREPVPDRPDWTRAVMFILLQVWYAQNDLCNRQLWPMLGDSWVNQVLKTMQDHYKWVCEETARRQAYDHPVQVLLRRDAKRRAGQKAHALRQASKKPRPTDFNEQSGT